MTEPTETTAAKKTGVFDDFVDIITSPTKVFERRQDGKFGMPLLILTVICVALFFIFKNAMSPIMDAEISRSMAKAMAKNPNMTAEQAEMGRKMGGTFAGIGFAIFLPIGILITGLALWLVGKAFGAKESLKQALQIGTLSQVPLIIAFIVGAIQAMLMSPEKLTGMMSISLGPARFMDPETTNAGLLALVGRFDLFSIWIVVLMGIGLSIVGKIDRPKAWAAAVIAWVVAALPTVIPGLLS